MNEKPEALRLAERIDLRDYYDFDAALHCPDAARLLLSQHAEIKRLKAENERLREVLNKLEYFSDGTLRLYPTESEVEAALQEQPK